MTDAKYETGIIGKSINTATLALFGKGIKVLPYFLIIIGLLYILNLLFFNRYFEINKSYRGCSA